MKVLFAKQRFILFILSISLFQCKETEQQAPPVIPDWIQEEIEAVYERMVTFIDGEDVLVFPILTDLHLSSSGAYDHINYTLAADRLMTFDFVVNLGDIGLDVSTDTPEKAARLMRDVYNRHAQFQGITLFAVGNHDGNTGYTPVTEKEWITRFILPQYRKPGASSLHFHKTYGYYDIERTKTRVIILNTSEGDNPERSKNYYSMTEEQLNWLVSVLQFQEEGWNVIVLTHFCTDEMGKWNNFEADMINDDIFNNILKGYINRGKGKIRNVTWDFSSNKSNDLIANFCGDSHFDNAQKTDGLNRIITQGYGGVSEEALPPGAKMWIRESNMIVDIVVVKPSQKKFTMFRLGVGEDRSFNY